MMKREAKLLKAKALDSLILSIEHFNRPWNVGRADTVLLLLDHSFEMLLKASLIHRNGKIRDKPSDKTTIGFDTCVRRALSTAKICFLTEEQALTLQAINGLRDAAQHHILNISEGHLYLQAQSGVTLFRDLLKTVFDEDLHELLPERVLPVSTVVPLDPIALFADEVNEVARLLGPGRRRGAEAAARLRALAIVDGAMLGEKLQPSDVELRRLSEQVAAGKGSVEDLFPGIAGVEFATDGSGSRVSLRLTKKEGIPVQLVPEGDLASSVVAIKRVSELDYYNLSFSALVENLGITTNKTSAIIAMNDFKNDADLAKEFFGRWLYSPKALSRLRSCLSEKSADTWWREYKERFPATPRGQRARRPD